MVAPSPSGWVIQNADASAFSFANSVHSTTSLSDQALVIDGVQNTPKAIITPQNSPGDITETRVEFSTTEAAGESSSAEVVFAYQDINNFIVLGTTVYGYDNEIKDVKVYKVENGTISNIVKGGSSVPVDPTQGWVDLRFQIFRPTSSELSFRVSAADHGASYQSLGTETLSDSQLPFTSGGVGLTCRHDDNHYNDLAVDGDPVGSGGRPIKMYWA